MIGLTYIFHKAQWTPEILPEEWIAQGAKKGERLIHRYGINVHGEQLVRLAFEFAAAYATVKVIHYVTTLMEGFDACENSIECLVDALVCQVVYTTGRGSIQEIGWVCDQC